MPSKPIVLYVDDDKENLDSFSRAFRFDYDVRTASSGVDALKVVGKEPELALLVVDQRMPRMTGIEFLKESMKINPHPQRLILTAFTDNDALLKAIQDGHVYDYLVKPWKKDELKVSLDKAIDIYNDRLDRIKRLMAAEQKIEVLKEEVKSRHDFETIVGHDSGLSDVMEQVKKVAATNSTVILRGETGTGKELVARAIHDSSPRMERPFVAVHCAALSEGILESELFGHEKGAFTNAVAAKKGRFELADGGTLFLDEVGDIPLATQVKLLRVIQEKVFERVGGVESKKVDVRLITATNRDLEQMVKNEIFRDDLFFRINVVPIVIPPLRDRIEDIEKLVDHSVSKYNREFGKSVNISGDALSYLKEYDWPGNIRELQNVIERAVILAEGDSIDIELLKNNLIDSVKIIKSTENVDSKSIKETIQDEEARHLASILRKAGGNVSEASRMLGIARSTLIHRLKKYGLV